LQLAFTSGGLMQSASHMPCGFALGQPALTIFSHNVEQVVPAVPPPTPPVPDPPSGTKPPLLVVELHAPAERLTEPMNAEARRTRRMLPLEGLKTSVFRLSRGRDTRKRPTKRCELAGYPTSSPAVATQDQGGEQ
jgi:hypothetical protein